MLSVVTHSISILAARHCLYNEEYAKLYPEYDSEKVYEDYRAYINMTFLATIQRRLDQDKALSLC